jgi:hypothetical protein
MKDSCNPLVVQAVPLCYNGKDVIGKSNLIGLEIWSIFAVY